MYIKQVRVWMAVTPDEYELPIAWRTHPGSWPSAWAQPCQPL